MQTRFKIENGTSRLPLIILESFGASFRTLLDSKKQIFL